VHILGEQQWDFTNRAEVSGHGGRRPWQRWALLLMVVVTALAIAACGSDSDSEDGDGEQSQGKLPARIPAFSADELSSLPRHSWLTNGGTLANQRYSPLNEITDKNVDQLKGVWHVDLATSEEAKYSAETQIITYNGTMYLNTGANDVFAINAKDGEQLWKVKGKLDQKISTVCCGWLSRGVAIGEGKVFAGRLDGEVHAYDADTGDVEWKTKVVDWKADNSGITMAPLYYNGTVFIGNTGGEFGARGRLTAFDAKTGKEKWRWYATAGPEDKVGGDSWAGDSYQTGGAPIWQTPSIDPELGMIYFSTGNANPDVDGSGREGDNLYSASMVALDVKTGKYKWHFQQVHHDIWDYDAPSPTILYDAKVDGKSVPAIAQASKTGFLYVLRRETGKPLWEINEEPVPQDDYQKTSPTQPIPRNPPFVKHEVTDAALKSITEQVQATTPKGKKLPPIVRGEHPVFAPPTPGRITVIAPGPTGGTNWPPSSYNRVTNMIYVCSLTGQSGLMGSGVKSYGQEKRRLGSVFAPLPFGPTPGNLTAINGNTGEIEWQKDFPDSCYSGSVTTAGNLVFVGRNGGELEAYSADKGETLWSFQTGAGANNTVTVFELDGKQYVAFYAGGNSLAATPHGDELWLFSLDGELDQAPAPGPGSGTDHYDTSDEGTGDAPDDSPEGDKTMAGNVKNGQTIYSGNCSVCHGPTGAGGNGGPPLTDVDNLQEIIAQTANGGGGMPAFGDQLSEQEVQDVAAFVAATIGKINTEAEVEGKDAK